MKKIVLFCLFVIASFININIFAYSINKDDYIYVGGQSIGLDVKTNVCVVGTYGIELDGKIYKPWQDAKIKDGDYIIKYANSKITDAKSLEDAVKINGAKENDITIKRNNYIIDTKIKPVLKNNIISLGLYIKDNILGVGTLTYYLPKYDLFGSLGHKLTNNEIYGGNIYNATINSIIKSKRNSAGEKRASITGEAIGDILKNTISGVHGRATLDTKQMVLMQYKKREEVHTGDAYIRTCIEENKVEEFSIKITKCYNQKQKDIKGMKIEVTDERLISKTGGIIQGMSGSPIIQDNKLVGALTHVILSNPLEGYGIYLEFMYDDLDINISE